MAKETLPESMTQDRRRTIRIRRSSLTKARLESIDRPAIKIAETLDEHEQSFQLVFDEYVKCGYVSPNPTRMLYNIYSLLPETSIFVFKSYLSVISTMTEIFDSDPIGLPMDAIYRREVDKLRAKGRKVVELGALATPRKYRWCNLMVFLSRAMFQYSIYAGVNDICITVNPKHVDFYKTIYLFEDFGPERHYPSVGAPAVALRVNLDEIAGKLKKVYQPYEFDSDLHSFFCRMNATSEDLQGGQPTVMKRRPLSLDEVERLLSDRPEVLAGLSSSQIEYLHSLFPLDILARQAALAS